MLKLTEPEFTALENYVRENFGISMDHKQYLVESKLGLKLPQLGFSNFAEYWNKLLADKSGAMEGDLLDCLTTNYTYFYREEKHFKYLAEDVAKSHSSLNIWCAGCATGQESYTLAMQLAECQQSGKLPGGFHILATDISQEAIKTAQTGIYRKSDYERLPPAWQREFFLKQADDAYIVVTSIRDHVRYMRRNLMDAPPRTQNYDIVFCRNVLIYFNMKERRQVVEHLAGALKPGGLLFIGHTESLLGCDVNLEYIRSAVYRKPKAVSLDQK